MRIVLGLLAAMSASAALAQDSAPLRDQFRDALREALRDRLRQAEAASADAGLDPGDGVIDFEAVRGDDPRLSVALNDQYRETHGASFASGASVHFCTDNYDEFQRSLCPYPRGASGSRVAASDAKTPAFDIRFDKAIEALAVRVNPTGGQFDEFFTAELRGFDAAGNEVARNAQRFSWAQNAFRWPTSAALRSETPMARVTISLRRAANNQPVRFLIDDLALTYAPDAPSAPPVATALAALDGPPKAGRGVIVQSPEIGPAQSGLRLYPAAVRKRLAIDWDSVDAARAAQSALGLVAPAPIRDGPKYADLAELPILLPADPDPGTLMVFGNKDAINAVWRKGGRGYAVYGSRVATVLSKPGAAPGVRAAISFSGSSDDLTASFSLYGASYAMSQYCLAGGAEADPDCYDRERLGREAEGLVVFVGEAGRTRP